MMVIRTGAPPGGAGRRAAPVVAPQCGQAHADDPIMERARHGRGRVGERRWAGSGHSALSDPALAGRDAVRAALAGRDDARLVLLFASGVLDVDAIVEGAADAAGDVPIAGSSTAGCLDVDAGVVALALGGEGLSVSTVAAPTTDPREAGMRAAACVGDVAERPHRLLLLFADGPSAGHADLVRGAYTVTGAGVPLAGAIAAHPLGSDRGAVFHGGAALRGAAIGVALGSDAPLGLGAAHSWEPIGSPLLVTRAARGRVLELDGRPAIEVYRERTGLEPSSSEGALGHPLARHGRDGPTHVRTVELDGAADGGLRCALEAGSLVSVMRSRPNAGLDVVDAAAAAALAPLGDAGAQGLLAFDCAARRSARQHAGVTPAEELDRLALHAGDAAVAAVSTHGELARTRGVVGLHHQSLVVVAIG